LALLSLLALAVWPAFAWIGYARHGTAGVQAASVAGLVAWLGACLAFWLASRPAGGQAVSGVLLGTLFRLGLPLAVGVVLDRQGGPPKRRRCKYPTEGFQG
jgi:hypothetical protein